MNAGTKIVRSCELVDSLWTQVEDLGNSLGAMTQSALERGSFGDLQGAGPAKSRYGHSASGWSTASYAIGFPVAGRKQARSGPTAWINYQISVFGSGLPSLQGGGQESIGPVVHVSFWNQETDFGDPTMQVTFPPAWEDWDIQDDRLLYWESEKRGQLAQWTFSLRLLELNSEDALRICIIEPVGKLLGGARAADALPAGLPGLVLYANQDQGQEGWDLVAQSRTA